MNTTDWANTDRAIFNLNDVTAAQIRTIRKDLLELTLIFTGGGQITIYNDDARKIWKNLGGKPFEENKTTGGEPVKD